jgi:glycosyltransferase involved in cell wall biosynthesis
MGMIAAGIHARSAAEPDAPPIPLPGGLPRSARARKRVLVCVPRYLPGYKSGGPTRAIANMVDLLSDEFDFYIVTRDRDATDTMPYQGVTHDQWHRMGNTFVLYCSSVSLASLFRAVRTVGPDVISLNSFQDELTRKLILLRWTGAAGRTPVVLAPRGEFSPQAMKIKSFKKSLYRFVTKALGFHEDIHWMLSSEREIKELYRAAPAKRIDESHVKVVREICTVDAASNPRPVKDPGYVKLIFLARISAMKNLDFLLGVLMQVRGRVDLNIYGPVAPGDQQYWNLCRAQFPWLPVNVRAAHHGPLRHEAVSERLRENHFFVLPTRGENFCHAAVESLINGTPVILSDETPWSDVQKSHAGFVIPLHREREWAETIEACVAMSQNEYSRMLLSTQKYARQFTAHDSARQHAEMLKCALGYSSLT